MAEKEEKSLASYFEKDPITALPKPIFQERPDGVHFCLCQVLRTSQLCPSSLSPPERPQRSLVWMKENVGLAAEVYGFRGPTG